MQSPTTRPASVRILIVDADRRVRESLRDLLCCEVGTDEVVAVGTAAEARSAFATGNPDVVVIDPHLPGVEDGLDFVGELRADHPGARLLVMQWPDAMPVPQSTATRSLGAEDAILDKSSSPEDLVVAITRSIGDGPAESVC